MKRAAYAVVMLLLLATWVVKGLPAQAADTNLIANPSVETANASGQPASWTVDKWGTNTTTTSYKAEGHTGSKSLYVSMTARISGDAKWVADPVAATGNTTYTYSDWYKSSVATELDAQYTDASGNVTYAYLGNIAASADWKQVSVQLTTPANATKVSILHIIAAKGWLQTDDFSLASNTATPPPVTPPPVTPPPSNDGNLLANPSFETASGANPANWTSGSWGTNNAQFKYDTKAHTGSKSATVSMTSYTSGDAKWYADPVAVTAGSTYTYSDWYQSTVASHVVVAYIDAAGNYTYADLADAAKSAGWAQYSANFTVPTGATKVQVFHLISAVGSLTIDDASLTTGATTPPPPPPPTSGNLVPNPSVETINPNKTTAPLNWQSNKWGTNTTTFSYPSSGAHTGSRAVSINTTKYTDGDAKWFFDPVTVTPDTQYKFSDYYKASTATEVDVAFDMADGSTVYQIIGLPEASTNWAQFSTTFTVPQGAKTMTVYHLIHAVGSLTIDDQDLETYKPTGFTRPLVTLTFDDGYDNEYTQGLPLLQKYGFASTQFIITGTIGQPGYMTAAQVKKFAQAGHEMASHTVTHTNMLTETPAQYDQELSQSKTKLQNWIGAPVTDLAFPNGLYNQAIVNDAKKYYTATRGVEDGLNSKDNFNAYDIKVQNIYDTTTTAQVTDWLQQAAATKTWLVLVYHSVNPDTSAGDYNVTPTQLDAQLAAIKASGLSVVTMQQALGELTPQL